MGLTSGQNTLKRHVNKHYDGRNLGRRDTVVFLTLIPSPADAYQCDAYRCGLPVDGRHVGGWSVSTNATATVSEKVVSSA